MAGMSPLKVQCVVWLFKSFLFVKKENMKSPILSQCFGLFVWGFYRNMAAQHGELCGREPAPCVDTKSSF